MHPGAQAPFERGAIVSLVHLLSKHSAEMGGFGLGWTVADNAFHRVVHCTAPAGLRDGTPLNVVVPIGQLGRLRLRVL